MSVAQSKLWLSSYNVKIEERFFFRRSIISMYTNASVHFSWKIRCSNVHSNSLYGGKKAVNWRSPKGHPRFGSVISQKICALTLNLILIFWSVLFYALHCLSLAFAISGTGTPDLLRVRPRSAQCLGFNWSSTLLTWAFWKESDELAMEGRSGCYIANIAKITSRITQSSLRHLA